MCRPAPGHFEGDGSLGEDMGCLVVGHREAIFEEEHDVAFEVDVDIAFLSGEICLGHIHPHRVIAQFVQVDVAYLIILAKDPKSVVFVLPDGQDIIIGDRVGVIFFMMEEEKALTVVAFDTSHGANPYIPFWILFYVHDDIGCQSVAYAQVREEVLLLGEKAGCAQQEQASEEDAWYRQGI